MHDLVGAPYDFGPLFFPTEEERDRAEQTKREQIGERYVAWALAGSRVDKIYPYSAHAICRIIKELDVPVVLVGYGEQQFEFAKSIRDDVRRSNSTDKHLHLAMAPALAAPDEGKDWTLRRSLTQTHLADIVISPDSGVAWSVAFEPMPKVIMLSHASAENITKHWINTVTLHADVNHVPCWPCHRLHENMSTCTPAKDNPQAAACISDIEVEVVVEEVRRGLTQVETNVLPWPKQAAE